MVGDVAPQDVQAVERRRLGARNRRVRRIVLALDALDAHRRVDERLDRDLRKRREKRRALEDRLRVRVDLPEARHGTSSTPTRQSSMRRTSSPTMARSVCDSASYASCTEPDVVFSIGSIA